MATKAKKTTSKKQPAVKKTVVKATKAKKTGLPVGVLYEKCPEDHRATGKYVFFYCMFAATTIIFAALAVWLFIFSSEVLNKYESIEACARTHGARCEIYIDDGSEVAE